MIDKEPNKQKESQLNKEQEKKKGFQFQSAPKPFQQFSNPNKPSGGPPKSFNAFHRRLGK